MTTTWWMIRCTQAYEAEFERLWEAMPELRRQMAEFETTLQRRDLESWLARTAEPRGTHLWIVRQPELLEFMLECYPEDSLVRLIWPRIISSKGNTR